jgi:hypothetical protein
MWCEDGDRIIPVQDMAQWWALENRYASHNELSGSKNGRNIFTSLVTTHLSRKTLQYGTPSLVLYSKKRM